MKKLILGFLMGSGLGVSASLFWFLPAFEKKADDLYEPAASSRATTVPHAVKDDSTPRLQAEIAALKTQLAFKDDELNRMQRTASEQPALGESLPAALPLPEVAQRATPPEERRSWLENLQANDPERYREIMERRETARETARYEIARKAAHLLFREDIQRGEEEADEYRQMIDLLHESMLLTERLGTDDANEDRREIMRTLRGNLRTLGPLLETERDRELFRIGRDLGYSEEDAAGFALYIRDVIDITSVNSIFRGVMRDMGGWGGGGGGPR